ncbi:TPA: hypothetical protein ACX6NP_003647 [Photobacterium damselae]
MQFYCLLISVIFLFFCFLTNIETNLTWIWLPYSIFVFFVFIIDTFVKKRVLSFPILAWITGEFIVWIISFYLLQNVFDFELTNEPDYRYFLFSIYITVAFISSRFLILKTNGLSYKVSSAFIECKKSDLKNLDRWFTLFSCIYFLLFIFCGGLSAREVIGNNISSSTVLYWLRGFEIIPYPFFFIRGFISRNSKNKILLPLLFSLLMLLSGGRGITLYYIFMFLIGWGVYKKITVKEIIFFCVSIILCFGLLQKFGEIRDSYEFINANSFEDKISAIFNNSYQNDFLTERKMFISKGVLLRINEPFAQDVIDKTKKNDDLFYFGHFDRIIYLYTPSFLVGDLKKTLQDGSDILKERFGYSEIDSHISLPITIIADIYQRWGEVGLYLAPITIIIYLFFPFFIISIFYKKYPMFVVFMFSLLIINYLRIYPQSYLGVINEMLYTNVRNGVIVLLMFSIASKIKLRLKK